MKKLLIFVLMSLSIGGCGSGGNESDDTGTAVVQPPSITGFTASAGSIVNGESLTLTPVFSNGSGAIDNGIGAVTSETPISVAPTENRTYTLTVLGSSGATVTASVSVTVEKFRLTVVKPQDNQLVSDEFDILARIRSSLDIVSADADVQGLSTPLVFSEGESGFVGQLSLTSVNSGTYTLTVNARDVDGDIVSKELSITLDNPPVISIVEPLPYTVARPGLPVDVSCTDDVAGCDLTIKVQGVDSELASGVDVLTETLDLTAFDGEGLVLRFQAQDTSGQRSSVLRNVFVEQSTNLDTIAEFPGRILDFDGQRALVLTSEEAGDRLDIHDIGSSTVEMVEVLPNLIVSTGNSFLTGFGAIYTAQSTPGGGTTARTYDWNNGTLTDLGRPNSAMSLTVAGDYAIWNTGGLAPGLWLRQLSTGTDTLVSSSAGNWRNDVAENGVVAYWSCCSAYTIRKYDAGAETTLASDVAYWNTYPLTDGNGAVYRKHNPCCASQQYAISFHDGASETVITNFRAREIITGQDYQIREGWIAYTELGGLGQTHVWTRDPGGSLLQRTVFGSDSYIDELGPDGEVMLINSKRRYFSDASGQNVEVSSSLGTSANLAGTWYVTIGRSLFTVN